MNERQTLEMGVDLTVLKGDAEARRLEAEQQQALQVPPAEPQPSAVETGGKAALEAAGQGAESFMTGLTKFLLHGEAHPEDVGKGIVKEVASGLAGKAAAAKEMFDGLMGVLSSPGAGVGAGMEQALKNVSPARAKLELLPGGPLGPAAMVRAAAGQELNADTSPMTLGEAVNLVTAIATPFVAGRVKKGLPAGVRAFGEQRGELGKATTTGTMGEPAMLPPGESRVNVDRVAADESVKRTMTAVNRSQAAALAEHRATQGHAQTIAEGQALQLTVERALALDPMTLTVGEAKAHQQAMRDTYNASAKYLDELGKSMDGKDADAARQAANDYVTAFAVTAELAIKDEVLGGTGARLLEARKIMSDADRAIFSLADVRDLASKIDGSGIDPYILKARLDALKPAERRSFAGKVGRYVWSGYKNVLDLLHWLWIQSLLSGPQTHAANVLGTGAIQLYHIPERMMAGMINEVFFRNPEGVRLQEAWAVTSGLVEGAMTDSVRMMGRALKGEGAFGQGGGRVEARFDLTAKTLGMDPESTAGHIVDIAGMMMPTRLMGLEDAFFKGTGYRTEIKALARREALAEHLTGTALADRVGFLEANPTLGMLKQAEDAAAVRTLNAPLGKGGQAFMSFANLTPGVRYIIPFIRTPANIAKWVWQRAPVLNMLSYQNYVDIAAGGAKRDMALARMALGNAVAAAIVWQTTQGNITGEGPANRNLKRDQREDGIPAYSIRVGDEYFSFNRLDPIGMYIGAIATAVETVSQVPDPGEHWDALAFAFGVAAARGMLSKTWAQGVSQLLDAVSRPDRDAKKYALGFARSLTPALARQSARSGIPGVVEAHPEMREIKDYTDAILSSVPDLSPIGLGGLPSVVDVPPQLHPITGDPMTYPAGWGPDLVSPIYITTRKNDPVLNEIIGNEVSVNRMPRTIDGRTPAEVQLTPERVSAGTELTKSEYLRVQILATKAGQSGERGGVDLGPFQGLPTLYDALHALIASDVYQTEYTGGPDGSRARQILNTINVYREMARGQLQRESEPLRDAIQKQREGRIKAMVPEHMGGTGTPVTPGIGAFSAAPRLGGNVGVDLSRSLER